jgi:hypothetical protein
MSDRHLSNSDRHLSVNVTPTQSEDPFCKSLRLWLPVPRAGTGEQVAVQRWRQAARLGAGSSHPCSFGSATATATATATVWAFNTSAGEAFTSTAHKRTRLGSSLSTAPTVLAV